MTFVTSNLLVADLYTLLEMLKIACCVIACLALFSSVFAQGGKFFQNVLDLLLKCFDVPIRQIANKLHVAHAPLNQVVVGVLQPSDVWLEIRLALLVASLAMYHGSLDLAPHAAVSVIAEAVKFTVLIAIGAELLTTVLALAFVMDLNWVAQ